MTDYEKMIHFIKNYIEIYNGGLHKSAADELDEIVNIKPKEYDEIMNYRMKVTAPIIECTSIKIADKFGSMIAQSECPKCQSIIYGNYKFCPECGQRLAW